MLKNISSLEERKMKEKITDLLESIVEEKPVDTKDLFEQVMLDKIRKAVADHEPVVAASLFEDEEVEEEVDVIEHEDDDQLEEGDMSDWDIVSKMKGKQVVHKGKVHTVSDVLPKGKEMMNTKGEKTKLAHHMVRLDRGKRAWPLDVDHREVKLHNPEGK